MPVLVSDRTCEPVLGVSWRTLRRFLEERGVAYSHVGRRPVVRLDRVLEAIEGPDAAESRSPWNEADVIERASKRGGR